MRIYTKIIIDMSTLEVLEREGYDYSGPIAECKGDQTAQNTENSQSNFTNQLQSAFATNNAAQQNQLNFLNNKLQSAINNPEGYSPSTLAAMRAQATDQTAAENQNAERVVNNAQAVKGGAAALPSGVNSQIDASIATQAGQQENQQQQQITEANANLQNQNYWNAVKGEGEVASLENPEGMAGQENNSAGEVGNLSQAVTTSSGPTFGSILGGVVGAGSEAAGSYFGAASKG